MPTSRTVLGRPVRPARAVPDRPGRGRMRFALAAGLLLLCGIPVEALDATARTPVPPAGYRTAREALRSGVRDYNAGDKEGAARALEYAAGQGHALALWKLGRMYAEGDGVPPTTSRRSNSSRGSPTIPPTRDRMPRTRA